MTQKIPAPDLEALLSLFYQDTAEFGAIAATSADEMPAAARKLLDHEHHMTVTVEDHHDCEVDVQVLETSSDGQAYSRKILLTKQTDSTVVQFGIVLLKFEFLATHVQQEIMAEKTPLGRILINHKVLRRVELSQLWEIQAGQDLAELFGVTLGTIVYGRTAWIYCNGEPAIELLEVVTPAS